MPFDMVCGSPLGSFGCGLLVLGRCLRLRALSSSSGVLFVLGRALRFFGNAFFVFGRAFGIFDLRLRRRMAPVGRAVGMVAPLRNEFEK